MLKTTRATFRTAQDAVRAIYQKCGTWRKAHDWLNQRTGQRFDRALLNRVARGKQDAPPALRLALGITRRRTWFDWPTAELASLVRAAVDNK